jgi:proteasome lid subunit RPN8/RPN11
VSRLVLSARHGAAIEQHAAAVYPEECCGVLVGRPLDGGEGGALVEQILPARNDRLESRHNRFLIPPEVVLAAHKEARAKGLDVVGYYHSHPDHPAVPSEFDREHAWPGLAYLIVSVEKGRAVERRSWRLAADRERFEEDRVDDLTPAAAQASKKERRKPRRSDG